MQETAIRNVRSVGHAEVSCSGRQSREYPFRNRSSCGTPNRQQNALLQLGDLFAGR